jgi:PhoPQ-activated pathogenicity-related protein
VNLWQATNPKARDFRVDTIGNAYTSTRLNESKPGVYIGQVSKPPRGFTAFFVELVYDSGGKYPFKFTTEVSVVPDVLPFRFKDAGARK